MSQPPSRIVCPYCNANNFPSSEICWRCARQLPSRRDQAGQPQTPPATEPPKSQPSTSPLGQYTSSQSSASTRGFIIAGFIFAALSLVCCPFLFSTISIVLGAIAYFRGDRMGFWVIIAGGLAMILGAIMIGLFLRLGGDFTRVYGTWPGPKFD